MSFNRPTLNCVKLLFGFGSEDVAEVRINGEYDEASSQFLKELDWPRAENAAFARCYLLFVHAEEPADEIRSLKVPLPTRKW